MSTNALWMRLRQTQWDQYGLSTQEGQQLDKWLQDLAGRKAKRSMKASYELWQWLKTSPSPQSLEVIASFLEEIHSISAPEVQSEISDLILMCQ